MSRALQSWSPRSRPLYYDALQQDTGCQSIKFGNKVFASMPFTRICTFEHTPSSPGVFNQLDTVSYATGPANTGDAMPWATIWAAWVGTEGIRVGKIPSVIPPADNLGSASSFYPTTRPAKVAIGFTSLGQLALAIQRSTTAIEIKWLKSTDGTNLITRSFVGVSPVLQNNGLLQHSATIETELVLYYVRPETDGFIYARFESENFDVEHVVNQGLQVNIVRLIDSETQGSKQVIFARDAFGRDITIYSDDYLTIADGDHLALSNSINFGTYALSAIIGTLALDKTKFSISVLKGAYGNPIKEPASNLSGDEVALSISINAGIYT